VQARTFAADAYTIVNGGFAARLDGEPTGGTTTWLDFPTQTLELDPGKGLNQTFTVRVPADAQPGEYLTSLVVQNATPLGGSSATGEGIAFKQIVRQAIAVSITIPGPLTPGLAIGQATHRTVAEKSSVAVALQNTGNVKIKPNGLFTLFDETGLEISRYRIAMDSFYAGTDTFVEVPFAQRLNPGDYTATLELSEGDDRLASSVSLAFQVPLAQADLVPQPLGSAPQLATVNQTALAPLNPTLPQLGDLSWPWMLAIVGLLLVIAELGWLVVRSRPHPARV
jgi:hypothetical protein